MIRVTLAAVVLATSAQADPFCDALAVLATTDAPSLNSPDGGEAANCRMSLMLGGGTQVHCSWSFDYRATEAQSAFKGTIAAVKACLGPDIHSTLDQVVNHPDFYDLQTFTTDGSTVGVSLKDKSALRQTLVFVRIEQQ
jgi:hypothetical protein